MGSQPSLGDAKFKLVRQEFETPSTRKELVNLFENIIAGGGVKKVVLEIGHPVKVDRFVKAEEALAFEAPPIEEIQDDDVYSAARNHEMHSMETSEQLSPFESLFRAFQYSTMRGFQPFKLLVTRHELIRAWLGLDEMIPVTHIYGVEVLAHPAIPEDCVLLVSNDRESGNVGFSVRVELVLPKRKKKEKS